MAVFLVAEDERSVRENLVFHLGNISLPGETEVTVVAAIDAPTAIAALMTKRPDVVITDMYMGSDNEAGLKVLDKAKELDSLTEVIILTANGSTANAVTALVEKGAFDYVEKGGGSDDPERDFKVARTKAIQALRSRRANEGLRNERARILRCTAELSSLFHDARSPLAVIQLYAQLQPDLKEEAEEMAEASAGILKGVSRLTALLNDWDGRVRDPQWGASVKTESVELAGLYRQVRYARPGIGVQEKIPARPVMVDADRVLIRSVMDNLFSNAVKFSPPGSELVVEIEEVPKLEYRGWSVNRPGVWVAVTDQGPGLEEDQLTLVFDKGWTGGHANSNTGMGLYLAKLFVQLHGGMIAAESEGIGKGATFRFCIPK